MIRRLCAVALLVLAASCGHKDTQSTTSTTTTAQTPSAAAPVRGGSNGAPVTGSVNPPGFNDEASAQSHCPSDQVVWLNTRSKIYHEKGTHFYGTTKNGEYACRKEADAAGDRNSKS